MAPASSFYIRSFLIHGSAPFHDAPPPRLHIPSISLRPPPATPVSHTPCKIPRLPETPLRTSNTRSPRHHIPPISAARLFISIHLTFSVSIHLVYMAPFAMLTPPLIFSHPFIFDMPPAPVS